MSGQQSQTTTPARLKPSGANSVTTTAGGGGVIKPVGPLKATIPISSVTKQGSDLSKTTTSPISVGNSWRTRTDCLGQRSPGSTATKGKSRLCNKVNEIRRTASLDTIYLKGLFPRDGFLIQRDRATQTDISNSLDSLQVMNNNNSSKFVEDNLIGKLTMRKRRRSSSRESNSSIRNLSPIEQNMTTTSSSQTTSSFSPNRNNNKSLEDGLNQEIERIIKSESDPLCSDRRLREPTPEGRKAPIADILRIADQMINLKFDDKNFLLPSSSNGSTTQSPKINKFLSPNPQTSPPTSSSSDIQIIKPIPIERVQQQQQQPPTLFQLKPSSFSAFESLNKTDDRKSPKVPDN